MILPQSYKSTFTTHEIKYLHTRVSEQILFLQTRCFPLGINEKGFIGQELALRGIKIFEPFEQRDLHDVIISDPGPYSEAFREAS